MNALAQVTVVYARSMGRDSAVWVLVASLGVLGCGARSVSAGDSSTEGDSSSTGDESSESGETGEPDPIPQIEPPPCGFTRHPLPEAMGEPKAAGDFDGDGFIDLVTLESNQLRVWLGDGAGGLSPTTPLEISPVLLNQGFVVGDVDGDGRDDFAYHDQLFGEWGGVWVHGFQDGAVAPGLFNPISTLWYFHRLVDTNGDGLADLSEGGYHTTPVRLYLSVGDGSFVEHAEMPLKACYAQDGDWADVDGNGELDLLLVDGCNGVREMTWVSVYTQHDGVFELREDSPQTVPWDPPFVRAGQFDGEPGLDLVTQSLEPQLPIVLHHGHGDGSFAGPHDIGGLQFLFTLVERVDLDADGLDDLIAQSNTFGVTWLRSLGGGEFSACLLAPQERYRLVAALDEQEPARIVTVNHDHELASWRP